MRGINVIIIIIIIIIDPVTLNVGSLSAVTWLKSSNLRLSCRDLNIENSSHKFSVFKIATAQPRIARYFRHTLVYVKICLISGIIFCLTLFSWTRKLGAWCLLFSFSMTQSFYIQFYKQVIQVKGHGANRWFPIRLLFDTIYICQYMSPFSKYLTVILMTSNSDSSRSSKVKVRSANRKPTGGFLSDLQCVQHCIRIRDIWCDNPVT